MARKEIANKYSLLLRSLIFPENNKVDHIYWVVLNKNQDHSANWKSLAVSICMFDMLSQSVIKFDPIFHILWRVNWLWSDRMKGERWQWRHVRAAARAHCEKKGESLPTACTRCTVSTACTEHSRVHIVKSKGEREKEMAWPLFVLDAVCPTCTAQCVLAGFCIYCPLWPKAGIAV